jgi:hypothetical protein
MLADGDGVARIRSGAGGRANQHEPEQQQPRADALEQLQRLRVGSQSAGRCWASQRPVARLIGTLTTMVNTTAAVKAAAAGQDSGPVPTAVAIASTPPSRRHTLE